MAEGDSAPVLHVVLACALAPGEVLQHPLELPVGATVADALALALARGLCPVPPAACGIWGKVVKPDALLHEGDRLELYRPLTVDPKLARRQRFARQGARGAGLFARRRPGGKQGY